MEKPSDTMPSRSINLIDTSASLLSGGLSDCRSYRDESCEGGIAAVTSYARNLTNGEPYLIVPYMDKKSQFVQLHPLGWSVNRLILNGQLGLRVFASTPSLLLQNYKDYGVSQHDLSNLQSRSMPLLLTNANVPPSNTWSEYTESVYFDATTGIALLSICNDGEPMSWPQIDSALGGLQDIADRNMHSGCTKSSIDKTLYDRYFTVDVKGQAKPSQQNDDGQEEPRRCWIPVIRYSHFDPALFNAFISAVTEYDHPPAVVFDIEGNNENYTTPTQVGSAEVWVVSYTIDNDIYYQHRLSLSDDLRKVDKFELITDDLEALPAELKDEQYANDIKFLRQLADEAEENDPIVGQGNNVMPIARSGNYRRCEGGECEIGNLFADSLRWKTNTDIAFVTSGGLRGSGWPEGDVRASNIWDALPFPNMECTGTMTGLSLFKLLHYSIGVAAFSTENTPDGGRLLQVSGMKVTYNTNLKSRLVAIDIWDKDKEEYLPVDRMRLYTFATDSYVCGAYDPYPDLLGANGNFFIEGEKPGVIGDFLIQNVVGEYLSQLSHPYNAAIEGRLFNDTSALTSLNLIQTEEGCHSGTYWVEEKLSCFACPNSSHVTFSDERIEFSSVEGDIIQQEGRVLLVNREVHNFSVVPRAIPSWMVFTGSSTHPNTALTVGGDAQPTLLQPGESLALNFLVGDSSLEVGTALGTVSFGILDSGTFQGCVYSQDATFDVYLRVLPGLQLNHLGVGIRSAGMFLMGLIMCTAIFFAVWVVLHRHTRLISTMQPLFLVTICVGVIIAASAIVPISIDDGLVPSYGCDVACMSIPWLMSIGCTVTFSALFSKLWRVNRLFHRPQFQRVVVTEKDVLRPVIVLFSINFVLLLAWTIADPWTWVRRSVDGEQWNTYGDCSSKGDTGEVLITMVGALNVGALLLACYQAYKAQDISKEFSEAKRLFVALYMMSQVIVVGIPVLALIDNDNVTAIYFLQVGIIFVLCMSMTLPIFLPIIINAKKQEAAAPARGMGRCRTHISGLNPATLPSAASTDGDFPRSFSTRSITAASYHRNQDRFEEEHGMKMSVTETLDH